MMTCILCGGSRFRRIYKDSRVEIVRCVSCGLARQTNYASTLSNLDGSFKNVESYYKTRKSYDANEIKLDTKKFALTLDIRLEIEKRTKPGGKILDVGCGRGEFLTKLKETGFDVYGVEPSISIASIIREQLKIPVAVSMYEESLFLPNSFDVITFIQVLEHLENPMETLAVAYKHLKVNGLLVINVPSFNNPRILAYRVVRWKELVLRDFIPSHCYYYTRTTLSKLVANVGFNVIRAETGRYAIKLGMDNIATRLLDKTANALGIGGITLFAMKQ
jgi:2-polyprenyl-3-methyl-5-hydroxy-6-metoxy-1,4-benzoquinol methylase